MFGPHLGFTSMGQRGQSGTRTKQKPHSWPASQVEHVGGGGSSGGNAGAGGASGGWGGMGGEGGVIGGNGDDGGTGGDGCMQQY
mmetsp:Transcript_20339/g.55889  ORF Transcript_20339/g.55889 Transcript_20339/m.55889 type:complete len:84 (+) Transcript_20339:879-1130(+)